MTTKKKPDPIPETFDSYAEAAEFWDTHDTTDYPENWHPVKVIREFRGRHYEIEIEDGANQTGKGHEADNTLRSNQ